ncbi:hypothetical protein F5146DRAFT_1139303 [Armillaria mellea]|nr:hypothetical protein F5146DRAFT_1139303 [Armillaria mellea]
MAPEEMQKKMVDMFGLTNDDMKALAPPPDENDPGHFEHEPRPDDDARTHVQVGDSQGLLTRYPERRLVHIPGFPRPVEETGDKAYRISPTLHRGLGMFAARRFKTGDLVADERPLMIFPVGPPTDFDLATAKIPGENGIKLTLESSDGILSSIFERMSEESREAFKGLQNSHLCQGFLLGTVRTNGYGLEGSLKDETENVKFLSTLSSDDKSNLKSLTILISIRLKARSYSDAACEVENRRLRGRLQGSLKGDCSPNIRRKFYISSFSMQLRAARDIEKSEEFSPLIRMFSCQLLNVRRNLHRTASNAPIGPAFCADSDPIRAAVNNRKAVTVPLVREEGVRPDAWIDPAVQTLARIEEEELQDNGVPQDVVSAIQRLCELGRRGKGADVRGEVVGCCFGGWGKAVRNV